MGEGILNQIDNVLHLYVVDFKEFVDDVTKSISFLFRDGEVIVDSSSYVREDEEKQLFLVRQIGEDEYSSEMIFNTNPVIDENDSNMFFEVLDREIVLKETI